MRWFTATNDLKQLHKQYVKLARQHHPDIGGSEQDMKEINLEYEQLRAQIMNPQSTRQTNYNYQRQQRKSSQQTYRTSYQYKKKQYSSTYDYLNLEELLETARRRNYKIGWVAMSALEFARSYEDCLRIARACRYKDGWAYYQWSKIEQER